MKKWLLLPIIATMPLAAQAEFSWFAEGSLGFGGDTMAEVEVETFDGDLEDEKIKAGEGLNLAIGGRADLGNNFDAALSIGYKFGGVIASDGSATFDRVPINVLISYNVGIMRLGLGLTREIHANLDLGDAGGPDLDVDDANGKLLTLTWKLNSTTDLGLRYTKIDYELSNFVNTYNGDHFDLYASFHF